MKTEPVEAQRISLSTTEKKHGTTLSGECENERSDWVKKTKEERMMEKQDFAVRWRLGGIKDFNERMSRWHGTSGDGIKTECGLMVPVFAYGHLPEAYELDDYKNKITCKKCQKAIAARERSNAR